MLRLIVLLAPGLAIRVSPLDMARIQLRNYTATAVFVALAAASSLLSCAKSATPPSGETAAAGASATAAKAADPHAAASPHGAGGASAHGDSPHGHGAGGASAAAAPALTPEQVKESEVHIKDLV